MQHFESKEYCERHQIRLQTNLFLQQGSNTFHFSCCIPEDLSSSLTTSTGFIRYKLVLMLKDSTEWQTLQHKIIDIQKYHDICRNPQLLVRIICAFSCSLHYIKVLYSGSAIYMQTF